MSRTVLSPEQKDIYDTIHLILSAPRSHRQPVLVEGETGTGKNFLLDLVGRKIGLDVVRCNLSLNTTAEDLWGQVRLRPSSFGTTETYFETGPALDAAENGKMLLLDEVNAALPEVLFSLHALLEIGHSEIYVPQLKRTVVIHPNFRIAATQNPSEDYVGTREQNQAFVNRFTVLQMPELSDSGIALILESRFPKVKKDEILKIVSVVAQVKTFIEKEAADSRVSLRDAIKIAGLYGAIGDLSRSAAIVFSTLISRHKKLPVQVPDLKYESIFELITIADMLSMYSNIKKTSEFVKNEVPVLEEVMKSIAKE